ADGSVDCMEFAPNGRELATSFVGRGPCVWELLSGKDRTLTDKLARYAPQSVARLAFVAGKPTILGQSRGKSLQMWEYESGVLLPQTFEADDPNGVAGENSELAFVSAPDGRTVAVQDSLVAVPGTIIWDYRSGKSLRRFAAIGTPSA